MQFPKLSGLKQKTSLKKIIHSIYLLWVILDFFQLCFNLGPKLIKHLLFGLLLISIAEGKRSQKIYTLALKTLPGSDTAHL